MSLVTAFQFQADPRIVVVADIRDFSALKEGPGVYGVTMPNPVEIPDDPDMIAAVMAATRAPGGDPIMFLEQQGLARMPPCIRDTGRLIFEAFHRAGGKIGSAVAVRHNIQLPAMPHHHHMVGMADVFGSPTVGFLGEQKERPFGRYDFPRHHITVFKKIWHAAGDVQPGLPRLNMILG